MKKIKLKFRKLKRQEFSAKNQKTLFKGHKYMQPEKCWQHLLKNISPKTQNSGRSFQKSQIYCKSNTLHFPENHPKKAWCSDFITQTFSLCFLYSAESLGFLKKNLYSLWLWAVSNHLKSVSIWGFTLTYSTNPWPPDDDNSIKVSSLYRVTEVLYFPVFNLQW